MASDNGGAPPPSPSGEANRTGFHQRDPAVVAAEAALGPDGIEQVERLQDVYQQIFELIDEDRWPEYPEGPLATHWWGLGGQQSTYYLMSIAAVILDLMANASPGVGRTIKQRLRTILRPPDDHAYEEALVELEVGGMLARQVSPVLLEPLVPAELRSRPNPPMSPDYGLRVPESLCTVEVTVWHWEAYAAWHRMYTNVTETLSARMKKFEIARSVRILLPIGSPPELVRTLWSHEFCSMISDNESGEIATTASAAPRPIRVTWSPMPQFENYESVDWAAAASAGTMVVAPGQGFAYGLSVNPSIDDDDRRSALASLRRSIDRKKRQCDPTLPHFLAISPAFPEIPISPSEFATTWDVFGPLIEGRLWPNKRYSWLSGILQHTPMRVAPPSQLSYWVGYNPNPNAALPAPDTMTRVLNGEAEFHMMWQRPRRPEASPQ